MKYFVISTAADCVDAPRPRNWYGKIKPQWINPQNAHLLPNRELFFVEEQEQVVFTDILSKPSFMVSEMVSKVILMYEPLTKMKEILLLDGKSKESERYFLPILEEVDCMTNDSEYNADKSIIKRGILNYETVKDKAIFVIGGVKRQYVVGNLEFVESILKRGARGVGLQEIEYRNVK